jgi:hypothetical protein
LPQLQGRCRSAIVDYAKRRTASDAVDVVRSAIPLGVSNFKNIYGQNSLNIRKNDPFLKFETLNLGLF